MFLEQQSYQSSEFAWPEVTMFEANEIIKASLKSGLFKRLFYSKHI